MAREKKPLTLYRGRGGFPTTIGSMTTDYENDDFVRVEIKIDEPYVRDFNPRGLVLTYYPNLAVAAVKQRLIDIYKDEESNESHIVRGEN